MPVLRSPRCTDHRLKKTVFSLQETGCSSTLVFFLLYNQKRPEGVSFVSCHGTRITESDGVPYRIFLQSGHEPSHLILTFTPSQFNRLFQFLVPSVLNSLLFPCFCGSLRPVWRGEAVDIYCIVSVGSQTLHACSSVNAALPVRVAIYSYRYAILHQ